MQKELKQYLKDLKAYGVQENIPNVSDEVGQFLHIMIKAKKPKNILEIGCANGYSTIYMADAAKKIGSTLHTVDHSAPTFAEAQKNLKEVGLDSVVSFNFGDAREVIPKMDKSLMFDFVFVDGQKASYIDFWTLIQDRLNPGAVIIFDDMLKFQHKTKTLTEKLVNLKGFDQLLMPIEADDGILLMIKH